MGDLSSLEQKVESSGIFLSWQNVVKGDFKLPLKGCFKVIALMSQNQFKTFIYSAPNACQVLPKALALTIDG